MKSGRLTLKRGMSGNRIVTRRYTPKEPRNDTLKRGCLKTGLRHENPIWVSRKDDSLKEGLPGNRIETIDEPEEQLVLYML